MSSRQWTPPHEPRPTEGQISIHDILAMYNMFCNLPGEASDTRRKCITNLENVLLLFTSSLGPNSGITQQ